MVYYEFNQHLNIVAVRYVYEVTADQVINGLKELANDDSIPKHVKVIVLSEGVIPAIQHTDLDRIIEGMVNTLESFDSFRIAFIQKDPKNAALALLFSSRLHKRTDYHQEVFASIEVAANWAGHTSRKEVADYLNTFLANTPERPN